MRIPLSFAIVLPFCTCRSVSFSRRPSSIDKSSMSRPLTTHPLWRSGHTVGKYISLEVKIEELDFYAFKQKIRKFKKANICALCSLLNSASVERSLKALCQSGKITKCGNIRVTFYIRNALQTIPI